MNIRILIICIFLSQQLIAQSYKKIHAKAIVVDTHNDFLIKAVDVGIEMDQDLKGNTHSDLIRWKKGGLDVQVFSVYSDGDAKNPFAAPTHNLIPVEGGWNPDRLIIIQWNSMEQLQKFATSAEYIAIAGLRANSASTKSIIVTEYLN